LVYETAMQNWTDLIDAWGGARAFAKSLGIPRGSATAMRSRNKVNSAYWALIVARAPSAGLTGITLELLASLQHGHGAEDRRRRPRFRNKPGAQIMSV